MALMRVMTCELLIFALKQMAQVLAFSIQEIANSSEKFIPKYPADIMFKIRLVRLRLPMNLASHLKRLHVQFNHSKGLNDAFHFMAPFAELKFLTIMAITQKKSK